MRNPNTWAVIAAVLTCAVLSTITDALSVQFWKKQNWGLGMLVILIAPCVFFAFGYAGNKYGLSIASCITNSLVVIGPILVGLFLFSEWKNMTWQVYLGMAFVVIGITIVVLFNRDTG